MCKKIVGEKEGKAEGDSHGICPACMPLYLRQSGLDSEEIKRFEEKYLEA